MDRIRRKVTGVITTPAKKETSDELVKAVQNLLNILASNYDLKAEDFILFYRLFTKAPDEISQFFNIMLRNQEMGIMQSAQLLGKIRKKLMNEKK